MGNLDWGLELVLVALLVVTLVHAIRLERALRAMRNDRAALGAAIAGFDDSARQAEIGIGRLHSASAETAHLLAQRLETGATLKDDLAYLTERGEILADRLDALVRAARPLAQQPNPMPSLPIAALAPPAAVSAGAPPSPPATALASAPKIRSQAERELLQALQGAQ